MDHEQWLQEHDRMIADHEQWLHRHHEAIAEIEGMLRQAVRLSVREARNERRKRQELDDKITQLAAAQLVTEEKLQRLIEERRHGGNGGH
jgi:hypothetical protein